MKILVTGACGFLGAHLIRGLAEAFPKARILATDMAPPGSDVLAYWGASSDRIEPTVLDVTDKVAVATVLERFQPTEIVHAAALTPTPEMESENPSAVVDVNIGGTLAIVDAGTRLRCLRRIVVVSSAAVLGPAASYDAPVGEDVILNPTMLYGVTKVAAEGIALRLGEIRDVSTIAVRLASVYGAMERQTATRHRTSLVHRLAMAQPETAVSPQEVVRDWVHADDVAIGIAALIKAPALEHRIYNIGGGEPVGWRRLVGIFRAHGRGLPWANGGTAEIDVIASDARPVFSIERISGAVGFRPRSIEDGIAEVLANTQVRA
ncbi:NAD-dependent epimerase/dehydratase family protein [Microvirga antarctica]|uniref:NAD-dependent epimerase/dehydratase family protein n=1 Tax=Microvirga antarctica TaxID=2819233 RepID=UPI001B30A07B